MEPQIVADYANEVGEGPMWHPMENRLYWVDIAGARMYRLDPATGQHEQAQAIFDALTDRCEDSLFFIDSSIVKAHRAATGAKGGNWRRISAAHAAAAPVKFMPSLMKVAVPVA